MVGINLTRVVIQSKDGVLSTPTVATLPGQDQDAIFQMVADQTGGQIVGTEFVGTAWLVERSREGKS